MFSRDSQTPSLRIRCCACLWRGYCLLGATCYVDGPGSVVWCLVVRERRVVRDWLGKEEVMSNEKLSLAVSDHH